MFTVGWALKQSRHKYGDKTALIFGGKSETYRDLDEYTDRFARALRNLGLRSGDRVALMLPNGLDMVHAYFGVAKAGLLGVPLNLRWSAPEIAFVLEDAAVGAILAGGEFTSMLALSPMRDQVPIYIFGDGGGDFTHWDDVMASADAATPLPEVSERDPWVVVYTSGTTGQPKGAVRSHYSNVIIALSMASEFGISPDDVGFAILPMFHVNSMWFVTLSMVIGATCVIYSRRAFHPVHVVDEMNAFGVTYGMFVPSLLTFLADGVDKGQLDPATLKVLMTSSAPLDTTLRDRLLRGFPTARLFDIYGATEYGVASAMRHRLGGTLGSVGYAAMGQEIRILDANHASLPPGQIGEIYVRGPSLMDGYFRHEDATRAAFTKDGGFLTVGDLGYLTEDGLLYLVGRKQDMIIVAGENVYPKEVEDVLLSDSAVALAAVVGIADQRRGERPVALVVPRPEHVVNVAQLHRLCRERLADYKRPVAIEVVAELPVGPVGKVIRRLAKQAYLGSRAPS